LNVVVIIAAAPVAQRGTHAPAEQLAETAPAAEHAAPHAPQWLALVRRSVSQPLAPLPSQLPKPGAHVGTHAPAAQAVAVVPAAEHAAPHAPQWLALARRSVSQPLGALPSQLPKPSVQAGVHVPETQPVAEAPAIEHATPQAPQLLALVRTLVSQPLAALPSQSPKPAEHTSAVQAPAMHTCAAGQRRPQPPQFAASPPTAASQPLAALPSQSP